MPVIRQDISVLCYRVGLYSNLQFGNDVYLGGFSDNNEIDSYAQAAMGALKSAGIINGMGDNKIMPRADANRAQAAAIIHRMLLLKGGYDD